MDNKRTYKHGFFFLPGLRVFGISTILFSIAILSSIEPHPIVFIICIMLILIGLIFFSTKAIELDIVENKIIFVNNWLGLKQKTKESLSNYCNVSVIRQQYSVTSANWFSRDLHFKDRFQKYNVILLNKYHLKKQVIFSFDEHKDAVIEAEELSKFLHFDFVKFNPARTRAKKRQSNTV